MRWVSAALLLFVALSLYPSHPTRGISLAEASRGSTVQPFEPSRGVTAQTFICTAYIATGRLTKTGTVPQVDRTIAVDPDVIKLGSKVRVNGREYVAEDTGRLVRGRHVDLFVGSRSEAMDFGRRLVEVEIER